MKRALLQTAFVSTVLLLTMVLLIPVSLIRESFFPLDGRPRPTGDPLPLGIIIVFSCAWATNRVASLLFWKTHLSDERWSVFASRRSHGSR